MKVYDCFTFYNEFELLELRLNLLNDIVDYFVLVEADKTHKNDNKGFYFEERKKEKIFSKYLDKLIHVKVDDMPNYDIWKLGNWQRQCWTLENYQRNCITRGLKNLDSEDIVFISDIDEIPNPEVISLLNINKARVNFWTYNRINRINMPMHIIHAIKYPESLSKSQFHGMELLDKTPLALEQLLFYYFVNCKSKERWSGTVITKAKNLTSPQKMRDGRNSFPRIRNCGWHFSYLGGAEKILLKTKSIVDAPCSEYTIEYINNCIRNRLDIYGRKGKEYEFIDIDILPREVNDLVQKYPHLLLPKK